MFPYRWRSAGGRKGVGETGIIMTRLIAGSGRVFQAGLAGVAALTLVLASQAPASAMTRGNETVHVDAVFGVSRGSVVPLTGRADFAGLRTFGESGVFTWKEGAFYGNIFTPSGGVVRIDCVLHADAAAGRCALRGSLIGVGDATVTTLDPRPGGHLVFDADFPNADCPRCISRS